MKRIPFTKMSGSGNDFILIDHRSKFVPEGRLADFARKVCARKMSVGADGLIFIENSERVDFRWRFFNSDGSEAEMCGNGGRCAARFAVLQGIAPVRLSFETLAGEIEAEVIDRTVKLQMIQPTGLQIDLEVSIDGQAQNLHFINTGVPHVVKIVEDVKQVPVRELGRKIRFHPRFQPAGTNANFLQVVDRAHLKVRTYERGVEDETLACGTGAVASALIGAKKNQVDSPVEVETSGGEVLKIHFQSKGTSFEKVFLEGDTRVVYEGNILEEAYE
jgi:diaminopimelate epimerase